MMGSMRQTTGHYPGTGSLHIEKCGVAFPPGFVFPLKYSQPLAGIFGVAPNELEASFLLGEWRCAHIDAEHGVHPQFLAHTLMHHLLMDATAARVVRPGANRQVVILKFAPDAKDFDSLGGVGL